MATCKNCIHYEVCRTWNAGFIEHRIDMGDGCVCENFKDKSRYIELPDKVYQTDGVRVYDHEVRGIMFDCGPFAFDGRAIGQSVFLAREEAERALAERSGK